MVLPTNWQDWDGTGTKPTAPPYVYPASAQNAVATAVNAISGVATQTHAATGKTTPVNADEFPLADSAASFAIKKVTFANLKAAITSVSGLDLNVKDYGGAVGDYVANDTTAIQNTINAVSAAGGGVVRIPAGTYKITAQLTVPVGVSIIGVGQAVSVIKTASNITMMRVGSSPTESIVGTATPSSWTEGSLENFTLQGVGTVAEGLHVAPYSVSHTFKNILTLSISGTGYVLDATQNALFTNCNSQLCGTPIKILNGSATNVFIRCEWAGSVSHGLTMNVDAGLVGYSLGLYTAGGARDNVFIGCIIEQGTLTEYVNIVDGQDNKFHDCVFAAIGNASATHVVKTGAGGMVNTFHSCQFSSDTSITYLVLNAGFDNRFHGCTFNASGKSGAVISTSQYILLDKTIGTQPTVTNTFGSAAAQVQVVPWPSQGFGDTASRPNFGTGFSPIPYYDTTLGRNIWWNGSAWQDPASQTESPTNKNLSSSTNTFPTSLQTGTWKASSDSYIAWAFDPVNIFAYGIPVSGALILVGIDIPYATNVTNLILNCAGAGVGLVSGQNKACLFQGGNLKGTTADQTTAWSTAGRQVMAISGGAVAVTAGLAYVGFWANATGGGSTPPAWSTSIAFSGGAAPLTATNGAVKRFATDGTAGSRTTTAPSTLGTLTDYGQIWAAVS